MAISVPATQSSLQLPAAATLFGNWVILNTADNSAYSAWATAFQASGDTRMVYSSQSDARVKTAVDAVTEFNSQSVNGGPNAADSAYGDYGIRSTADAVLLASDLTPSSGVLTAKYDFPDMSTPYEVATMSSSASSSGVVDLAAASVDHG
ncbi:MAG: hypothetical protein IPL70_12985 [Uliginosibacterium sp.]|nr:hypothetical protein [Uliginosibacterium sp.]